MKPERFKNPTNKELIEISILVTEGELDQDKIVDMITVLRLSIDRLYENGDIKKPCLKENDED